MKKHCYCHQEGHITFYSPILSFSVIVEVQLESPVTDQWESFFWLSYVSSCAKTEPPISSR
jgi:hypothetical protein